jgi:hypothetical protein
MLFFMLLACKSNLAKAILHDRMLSGYDLPTTMPQNTGRRVGEPLQLLREKNEPSLASLPLGNCL